MPAKPKVVPLFTCWRPFSTIAAAPILPARSLTTMVTPFLLLVQKHVSLRCGCVAALRGRGSMADVHCGWAGRGIMEWRRLCEGGRWRNTIHMCLRGLCWTGAGVCSSCPYLPRPPSPVFHDLGPYFPHLSGPLTWAGQR